MCKSCVHTHLHSEYSSLDGYIKIPKLIEKVGKNKQPAVAITDHGTGSAWLELFHEVSRWNKENPHQPIKPIFGMEAYIVNDRTKRVKGEPNKHLLMWAKNHEGYKNLLKIHYEGYATGSTFIYDRIVPRIDHTLLTRDSCKGIMASTGCLASEIAHLLRDNNWTDACKLIEMYKKLFDCVFAELQPAHLVPEQAEHNDKIIKLAELMDLPLICTTDSHYLEESERKEHELVLAIQSKKDIYDPDRFFFEASHLMTAEELLEHFDAKLLENTIKLADMCEYPKFLEFKTHGYRLPKYPLTSTPEYEEWKKQGRFEGDEESFRYCMYLVEQNWAKKLHYTHEDPELEAKYRERLETEIKTIKTMGFIDYFLIVWDFVDWCKHSNIMTGCGRGSAGGSLLSYLLGITKLDPIKYDLLFSRFLNADRVSLPDIDMDIDKARRDEVKAYLASKYGQDHVASIATFNTMKVRACVKDIVRSLKLGGDRAASFEIADRINKTLENENDDISYAEAIKIPAFKKLVEEEYKEVGAYAQKFEGLVRQTGIHAAGVIIGAEPLTDTIPLMVDKNKVVATAYDGATLEKDGFLKMDLLGLKNLTIITDTLNNIEKVRGKKFNGFYTKGIEVFYDEPDATFEQRVVLAPMGKQMSSRAFKLLRDGRTNGVFQVEGGTMRELLKGVYANSIEDVAVVLALCRPGPLASGLTAEYGKRKRSGEDRDEWYLHPSVKPVLQKTYGIIVYQEQCMQLAVQCAGFTEPESDTLRKAIGKKIHSLMMEFEKKFVEGAMKKSGMDQATAQKAFNEIKAFAEYGFNKSHAVGYAHTTYETAYLKANFPAEFTGALLSNEVDQLKVNSYIREAINSGLKIKPVNINKSTMRYEVEDAKTIRRNLTTLKNVGAAAVEDILKKRPFKNMVDFLARTDSKRVTSRVIEALIKAGAFDGAFADEKVPRKTYYDFYDDCRKKIKRFIKRAQENDEKAGIPVRTDEEIMRDFPAYNWHNPVNVRSRDGKEYEIPVQRFSKDPREEWKPSEIVSFESEIYGAPVSFNIFDFHHGAEESFKTGCDPIYRFGQSLDDYDDKDLVYMMFVVQGCVKKSPYKKDPKKFIRRFQVEDRLGEGIITVFHKTYEDEPSAWKNGSTLVVRCAVNVFQDRKGLVVDRVLKNCGGIDGTM